MDRIGRGAVYPTQICKRCSTFFSGKYCDRCQRRRDRRHDRKAWFWERSTPTVYQSAKDAPPPDPRF